MSSAEIAALAAKNEYIEAKLDQAVEILMMSVDVARWASDDEYYPSWERESVRDDLKTLLFGSEMMHDLSARVFFQWALDIVNLPRVLASASAPIQGTKREVGQ